jgi:hypothetical protein
MAQPERVSSRDGVAYVSGGIGEDSQARLKARETEFNLKLVFSLVEGNYVADVAVTLKDAGGRMLLEHVAGGPVFMARLPAGAYTVEVSYEGRPQARNVRVVDRLRTEYFRWPSNPAADLPVSRWIEPADAPKAKAERRPKAAAAKPGAEAPRGAPVAAISGGIGEGALAAMKAKESEYNVKLVFTLTEGNYLADVGVVLRDAAGKTVVERVADGPILLARLPAGTYTASVTYNGKAQSRNIRVGERLRTEYFRWPATPGADFPLAPEQADDGGKAAPRRR